PSLRILCKPESTPRRGVRVPPGTTKRIAGTEVPGNKSGPQRLPFAAPFPRLLLLCPWSRPTAPSSPGLALSDVPPSGAVAMLYPRLPVFTSHSPLTTRHYFFSLPY